MMRHWREQEFERGLAPRTVRYGLGMWALLARHPRLYRLATHAVIGLLGRLGGSRGRFRRLPFASGWTRHRDFPAPEAKTFHQLWLDGSRAQ
jgi:L-lactate dehydrogenase complex protein LldF